MKKVGSQGGVCAAALLTGLMLGTTAHAQAQTPPRDDAVQVEEVVVTGSRRAQTTTDYVGSIAAIQGEDLEDLGLDSFEDYVLKVPGVSFRQEGGPGLSSIFVRGIGNVGGGPATTAFYFNDVPVTESRRNPDFPAFDLERIEFLRGPQGTLFGKEALGGVVRIITRRPDLDDFEVKLAGDVSSTDGGGQNYGLSAALNIPIITDHLGLRLVGVQRDQSGYIDRVFTGSGATAGRVERDQNANAYGVDGWRATLLARPFDGLDIELFYQNQSSVLDARGVVNAVRQSDGSLGLTQGTTSNRQVLGDITDDQEQYSATVTLDLRRFGTLTAIAGLYEREFTEAGVSSNLTQAQLNAAGITDTNGFDAQRLDVARNLTESEVYELRLVSPADQRLRYTLGLYKDTYSDPDYVDSYASFSTRANAVLSTQSAAVQSFSNPGTGRLNNRFLSIDQGEEGTEQVAAYGEINYDFTDAMELTVGLRAFDIEACSNQIVTVVTPSATGGTVSQPTTRGFQSPKTCAQSTDVVGKVAFAVEVNDDLNAYGLISQGFRAGVFNDSLVAPPDAPAQTTPDTLINYEVGVKGYLADRSVSFEAALFYLDWSDIQIPIASTIVAGQTYTANAGKARTIGAEFSSVWRVNDWLELGGNVTYLDAELTENAPAIPASEGDRIPRTPEWKTSTYIQVTGPVAWGDLVPTARISYDFYDEVFNNFQSSSTAVRLDSYGTIDAQIGLAGDQFRIDLYGNNLTDEVAIGSFGAGEASYALRPRTVGVRLSRDF